MVGSQHDIFRVLEIFSLDVEVATEHCAVPGLSITTKFLASLLSPVGAVLVSAGAYQLLNRSALLCLREHHFKRSVVQIYLFCFLPVTKNAMQYLICREVENVSYLDREVTEQNGLVLGHEAKQLARTG